ncbi:hypothetical protein H6G98_11140 [Nostoc sp. FACHB-857]|nr:hypothetical protein [Nostoc sp. FACHB-857]
MLFGRLFSASEWGDEAQEAGEQGRSDNTLCPSAPLPLPMPNAQCPIINDNLEI